MTSTAHRVSAFLAMMRQRPFRPLKDERGVAAVEFALLLPVMVTLYLGGAELSQALTIDRKVTLTARTVADLAAQVSTISNTEMTNLLDASTAVLLPYSADDATVTVSEISIDANGKATITWSDTKNGTAHTPGDVVTLPAALNIPSSSLIWGEVSYAYKPTVGYVITGTMTLSDQIYMRPRLSDTVERTS